MGWSNFIIIPKLKLVVETSRYVDVEDSVHFFDNLKELIQESEKIPIEIFDVKYSDMTISDVSKIVSVAEKSSYTFSDFDRDLLLLAWLEYNNMDFEIVSEFNFNEQKYKKGGYKIIRRW